MKFIKDCEVCKEEHMIWEYSSEYPWVICTTCFMVEQVDPFDQTCGSCHQRTVHGLPDKLQKQMDSIKKEAIKKWGDNG